MSFTFKSGWKYDQEKIAAAEERMAAAGCQVNFGAARPGFKGHWKYLQSRGIVGIFAQDDELKVLGHYRDPNCQYRGTCVEQGSGRGCEDTHISRIADGLIVGDYTLLAGEAAYGYMRNKFWTQTHKWGCQCGDCPDGMMGADFAEFAAVKGMIARGVYQDIDLTKPREDLAILWNNTGVPQHIIDAGADHKFIFHNSNSWEEYADATAAKNFGAICLPKVFYGTKHDNNGCCLPDGDGGHCTECCGVFILPDGTTAFVIQQSWPLNAVHYPQVVMTINGPKRLRPGSYAVRMDVLGDISSRYRDQVERWSSDCPPKSSFRKALAV